MPRLDVAESPACMATCRFHGSGRRAAHRLFAAVVATLMAGCSMLMPSEIVEMEKRTQAAATTLFQKDPSASRHYQVGRQAMHFVQVGHSQTLPLVIFIHGSPGDWRGWADYLIDADLAQRARLVAVDRPGFGESDAGVVERSLSRQSADLAPLLDQASPGQRVVLVGHSYGGPVAVRLAIDHPDKVTDLVILAGSVDPAQEQTMWYQHVAEWPIVSWLVPDALGTANREIMALKGELVEMKPLWSRLTQRVTVIQGGKDTLVPPANADFAQQMLTRASSLDIIRLPEMNHFLPWTQYGLVKGEIIKHLQ